MEKKREEKKKKGKAREKESKVEALSKKLKECQRQKNEYLAGWRRSRADFLNYKKGEIERVSEILKYANADLILKILPILDNFEKAETETPQNLKKNEYFKGLLQIKRLFQDFLKNQGVEEVKSIGEKFNPNFHEVVEEIEVKGTEPGIIIEEVQKGYKLHGKVIRPAKVRVTK